MNRALLAATIALTLPGTSLAQNDECGRHLPHERGARRLRHHRRDPSARGRAHPPRRRTCGTATPREQRGQRDLLHLRFQLRHRPGGLRRNLRRAHPLDCNDDACGLQSTVALTSVTAGQTYLVRVGGYAGSFGAGTIVTSEGAPPRAGVLNVGFETGNLAGWTWWRTPALPPAVNGAGTTFGLFATLRPRAPSPSPTASTVGLEPSPSPGPR